MAVAILVQSLWLGSLSGYHAIAFAGSCGWLVATTSIGNFLPDRRRAVAGLVWGLGLILTLYYCAQRYRDWQDLTLGYFGLGENARVLQNSVFNPRELFLRVNPEYPIFFDHVVPGVLPFALLWAAFPHLELMMGLQAVSTTIVAVPLYLLGKHYFRDKATAYFFTPGWFLSFQFATRLRRLLWLYLDQPLFPAVPAGTARGIRCVSTSRFSPITPDGSAPLALK